MKPDSNDMSPQFSIENEEMNEEYRLISLNCLSSAVSSIENVCGEGI